MKPTYKISIHFDRSFTQEELDFGKKWHYSESLRSQQQVIWFQLRDGDDLIGLAIFGKPMSRHEDAELELRRFCLIDDTPRNTESWFLSRTLKLISVTLPSVKKIISFSDPNYGHLGIIYKATNWTFVGEEKASNPRVLYIHKTGDICSLREIYQKDKEGNYRDSSLMYQQMIKNKEATLFRIMKKLKYEYNMRNAKHAG